jgi:PPOX class probable F420-dependent enzyme
MENTMLLDPNNPKHVHVDERLRSDKVIWLNSVRPDGRPHSVIVWFYWDGEHILIFSRPNNQKLHNIKQNPHVVLALDNTDEGGDVITIEGTAELLDEKAINATMSEYAQKYATSLQEMGWTAETMAADYSQPIRIRPIKLHMVS